MRAILLLLILGNSTIAPALDEGPVFGPEFTFPDSSEEAFRDLLEHARDHLIDNQPDGEKFTLSDDKLTSPNGWSFTVAKDPQVIEVRMKPMTAAQFAKFASDIQDAIFVSAANLGFFPAHYLGGGHINVDIGYFQSKPPVLLRNFIVDWLNHSELSMGIFNYDTNNATSYGLLPDFRRQVSDILAKFDAGDLGDIYTPSREVVFRLLNPLGAVKSAPDELRGLWNNRLERSTKSSELSFVDTGFIDMPGRIEIRAVRPQASVAVWVRQITLIRDRIRYLERNFTGPIPYAPWAAFDSDLDFPKFKLDPPISAQEAMRRFYVFVEEAGHRWADHRDYLWPKWIYPADPKVEATELEKFEASSWFQCRELLQKRAA